MGGEGYGVVGGVVVMGGRGSGSLPVHWEMGHCRHSFFLLKVQQIV